MKFLSETEALQRLQRIKSDYQSLIQTQYEAKAKNCLTCETKGVCCLDAHFVNVHITKLEAKTISKKIAKFEKTKQVLLKKRISETIEKYNLTENGDTFSQTFACPLFEKKIGCLIHSVKPVACIQHACYERQEDLPPDELQEEMETKIERLNQQTYNQSKWLPLPLWLSKLDNLKKD